MTGPPPTFAIHESSPDGRVCLRLTGELDAGSTPVLEDRLARLRARKTPVLLDLSRLEFIDSTGLHMLIRAVGDARIKGWPLQIDRELAPQVRRLFKLVRLDHFLVGDHTRRH